MVQLVGSNRCFANWLIGWLRGGLGIGFYLFLHASCSLLDVEMIPSSIKTSGEHENLSRMAISQQVIITI